MRINGVESRKYHRLDIFKTGQRLDCGIGIFRNRVADFRISDILNICNQEPDLASPQLLDLNRFRCEHTEGFHVEYTAVRPKPDLLPLSQRALKNADEHDHAAI